MEDRHERKRKENKRVKVVHVDDCCGGPDIHTEFVKEFDAERQKFEGHRHRMHKHSRRRHRKLKTTKMFTSKEEVVKYVNEQETEGIFVEVFKIDNDFYKVELSEVE